MKGGLTVALYWLDMFMRRHCTASAMRLVRTVSLPARSAIVRATLSTRW